MTTAVGPDLSDAHLARWRDAAAGGELPAPTRERWQILRAGVVNLWEFDAAEYWFADGRAQFVGANQSGKSTLMALTTLIMLAGGLDRQYVDTFGQSDKSFRYYVEPTDDARDRRETGAGTNRGWAWVEYGRLGARGPEFYTTLLYAQAKRGVSQLTPVWLICHGTDRVRAGLHLAAGKAVVEPRDLSGVPGLTVCDSGKRYAERLATELFGFADTDRYATVLEMLKVLRTPHLGQRLNPDWFTAQIRAALPPIARTEVEELAEGWQQLEQLRRDRDHAAGARDAVAVYLAKAWRPWADAVQRQHADALLAASRSVDAASRAVDDATSALDSARASSLAEGENTASLEQAVKHAHAAYEELLRSDVYRDAAARAARAEQLTREAGTARTRATAARAQADRAASETARAADAHERASSSLAAARAAVSALSQDVASAAARAGLGDSSASWAAVADTDRLTAAITARRGRVAVLRKLLRTAATAVASARSAEDAASGAAAELDARASAASDAAEALTDALQSLSDDLERWAEKLGDTAPAAAVREEWLREVTASATGPRPRQVLRTLLTTAWLDPVITPLTERIGTLRAQAAEGDARAAALDADAASLSPTADVTPPAPVDWFRRDRSAAAGAPLWRLVDPVDGLDQDVLDHVEAALAAAGLLDAWITADGTWDPARDGRDAVAVASGSAGASPLRVAEDAGELAPAVRSVLAAVAYADPGAPLDPEATVAISGDGRWRTPITAGRAGPAPGGASLLGTAARAAARRRRVAELRAQADAARTAAAEARDAAAAEAQKIAELRAVAAQAPDDVDVTAAGSARAAAAVERDRAEVAHSRAHAAALTARRRAEEAGTEAATHAAEHGLPAAEDQLDAVVTELDEASRAVAELRLASTGVTAAERDVATTAATASAAAAAAAESDQAAREAAAEASEAAIHAEEAGESVARDDRDQIERATTLQARIRSLDKSVTASRARGSELSAAASSAATALEQRIAARDSALHAREAAFVAWSSLHPGHEDPVALARETERTVRPANWPDTAPEKAKRVQAAMSRALGNPLAELRTVLEASGGRSAHTVEPDETHDLPSVAVVVDASGAQLSPAEAVTHLDELVTALTAAYDGKLDAMYTELLASTFIDHLADRQKKVVALLAVVNEVLERHPTGANRTTLRLRRHPAEGQKAGYAILKALESGTLDSGSAQEHIRTFLGDRLREAQDAGPASTQEWLDHLARLLDYRTWFDVVAEFKVAGSDYKPLTRQAHGVDSGGGKVVTLLQPLLATLVALYSESPQAPRPLWLDEAFEGVDPANRATMLRLLVDFDLDFLLAGPSALVAAAQVPAAAVWIVSRAPAPTPGVDLSLMLWAGKTLEQLPVADHTVQILAQRRPVDEPLGPDLFDSLAEADT
ncbi:SbcC/MukB-like Walker B domain-containing protein [Actinoplanes sp. RD1]|uniref:SbcC/MukB-like Walker B domain-containing protein n=1 Tax=Actinoplanes sp. RD1 TaxID=3064538 RepID=UPI002740F50C|nr:SbcC/MukB-like Walker B domain-containing protein [Actinoplanes sp. RD1]